MGLFPKPSVEAVIGYSGDEPIGFAIFFHTFSTFLGSSSLYLEDLFVLPEWRGNGLGRQLLSYLAHLAMVRDCQRLEWSVLDWNEPSIHCRAGHRASREGRINNGRTRTVSH